MKNLIIQIQQIQIKNQYQNISLLTYKQLKCIIKVQELDKQQVRKKTRYLNGFLVFHLSKSRMYLRFVMRRIQNQQPDSYIEKKMTILCQLNKFHRVDFSTIRYKMEYFEEANLKQNTTVEIKERKMREFNNLQRVSARICQYVDVHPMKYLSKDPSQKIFKAVWNKLANIAYFFTLHCTYLFKRGDQIYKCMWFNPNNVSSIAQWIVYMLQCQIKIAYVGQKKNNKDKSKQKINNLYQYLRQRYSTQKSIKQMVLKTVINNFLNDETPKSQNYQNKKNFLVSKCMDRIKQEYDKYQYLIEYSWYHQNITNDNFKILSKLCSQYKLQYREWADFRAIEIIYQYQQKEKQKKISKIKRKRQKLRAKTKKQGQQDQKKQQQNNQQEQLAEEEKHKSIQSQYFQVKQINQATQISINQIKQQFQYEERLFQSQIKSEQQQNQIRNYIQPTKQVKKQEKPPKLVKQERQKVTNKKIIRSRINQYYEFFTNQLTQTASSFDKYRKITWNVIHNFIQSQILGTSQQKMQQQNFVKEWKLQIYGSASAGFSLKHSDLDLVLLTNNSQITLNQIYYKLKFKQWSLDCKFIQAQIPIITLKVNLSYVPSIKKQLNSKQFKKIEGQLFSVDLTLAPLNQLHSGIQNTKQLKDILQTYPAIRNICILLKEYLRVRKLNKPYTGGIGSYVLIIMIHGILTRKNILGSKQDQKSDEYRMIKQISNFMENEFQPFSTVISSKKNCKIKADQSIHLNIVNPATDQLLKTSAFHITNIINQLVKLREFQQIVEKDLHNMNINEKKNMKNHFIKVFNEFLYGKQF